MVPGIANFSFAVKTAQDIEEIKEAAIKLSKESDAETFKIESRRSNKDFQLTSMQINVEVGSVIEKKAKMVNPDLTIKIEITNKDAFISDNIHKGPGGLPTNPKQKVIAMLSGGFDSPVAAYMMMKRGCNVILVHFQNENQMTGAVKNKIKELAEQLSKYQITTKLYIVPFGDIQKEIIQKVQADMRMLIYRRLMIAISETIAKKEEAKFVVVGDSLSQVASQTLENLEATYQGAKMNILSPLIGMDKTEIIDLSKDIGTYDISVQPYGDCCSYFVPKHPQLRANPELLDKILEEFDIEDLMEKSIEAAEVSED